MARHRIPFRLPSKEPPVVYDQRDALRREPLIISAHGTEGSVVAEGKEKEKTKKEGSHIEA